MFSKILNSFLSVIISGSLLASDIKADNLFQFFADKYFLETSFTQTTSKDFKDRQIRGKLNNIETPVNAINKALSDLGF